MNSYNKKDIAQLASETHFLRDNLEKVLRLVDVLQFIMQNDKLNDCLVLKGGTAINLTVFKMPPPLYVIKDGSLIFREKGSWNQFLRTF